MSPEDLLKRERLTLKAVINLARGAPVKDWSLSSEWEYLFLQLKDAIDDGALPVVMPRGECWYRFFKVRLLDLWRWLKGKDEEWTPLRRFCTAWAAKSGNSLDITPPSRVVAPAAPGPKPPPDRDAAIRALMRGGQMLPGNNVTWQRFQDAVRAKCDKVKTDWGYSDRSIERAAKKIAAKLDAK